MIKCIQVDPDKKSREVTERLIKKAGKLRLASTFGALNKAVSFCKKHNVPIMFIHLFDFPIPQNKILLLKKIEENGTQIIILSSKITIAGEAFAFNAADFVMLPTTTRRLWRACIKALKIKDYGIEITDAQVKNLTTQQSH